MIVVLTFILWWWQGATRLVHTCGVSTDDLIDEFTEPHFDRSALLIIDTQMDFLDGGASSVDGTTDRLPYMAELLSAYRAGGLPIVHVVRLYEGDDVDLVRRKALTPHGQVVRSGSTGAEIPAELKLDTNIQLDGNLLLAGRLQNVSPREVIMWKPRWSAFYRTPLQEYLVNLNVDTVVIAGCNFPNCPRATIFDASQRDLRIVVAEDAVSQTTPDRLSDTEAIGVRRALTADVVRKVAPERHVQR